jgi:hypothetical protein
MEIVTAYAEVIAQNWTAWLVSVVLIVAAVIDGYELRVPNWLTFPFVISGWLYSTYAFGLEGLGWSLGGTALGMSILLLFYMIGGMGAGDVKLMGGVGAWIYFTHTWYCILGFAITGRSHGHCDGCRPGQVEAPLSPVLADRQGNPGDSRPREAGSDCRRAEADHDAPAVRYSNRHRDHRLLPVGGDARMNQHIWRNAITDLLSPGWQAASSDASLPSIQDKLQRSCRLFRRNRRGAAAVEFAVIAPLFFLLVFGMIEYGRMVMVQQVITNASREGARRAVLDGATEAKIKEVVDEYLASGSIQGATVAVTPNPPTNAGPGEPVTVTVSVPFNEVSWLPSPMYLGGKTLNANTVMRRETNP